MKNKKGFVLSTYIYVLLVFFLLLLVVMLSVLNNTKLLSKKLQEQSESETALKSSSFSLVLLGNKEIELEEGSSFTDPGVIASSKTGLDLTYKVTTVSTVDTSKQGSYQISYRLTYNGITKEVVRDVKIVGKVVIYFDANGGEVSLAFKEVLAGDTFGTLPIPTKSGKTFAGWFTSLDYDTIVTEDDIVSGGNDITLYALWLESEYTFSYLGSEQTFIAPANGKYKLEVWGAQGGSNSTTTGLGSYSTGEIYLTKGEVLYINVGGKGTDGANGAGGYNGGGRGYSGGATAAGGGGATHIATVSGLLSTLSSYAKIYDSPILIVAGGGGGACYYGSGGVAGGITGSGSNPGTQTGGNAFGQGAGVSSGSSMRGGGGGGYYGGGHADNTAGGGGSGYIGNINLISKSMYCYDCTLSDDTTTKTLSTTCTSADPTEMCAKQGNGYAKITLLEVGTGELPAEEKVYEYASLGKEQTFTAPKAGYYKLEAWGGQGGSNSTTTGLGSYSTGEIYLTEGEVLYLYVGGKGTDGANGAGGYNGGGRGYSAGATAAGGGGATHIATTSGLLSSLSSNKSSIIIVAGGGGGACSYGSGGVAGGITGSGSNPGTQTSGNAFGQGAGVSSGSCMRGGGGGGYYGGGHADNAAGGGGSGYIGNSLLSNKSMYCYNCTESSDASTKTVSTTCTSSLATSNCAKQGEGHIRIKYLRES